MSLSHSLDTEDRSLLVDFDATETKVKAAILSGFQVVAFATHDLVAEELAGISEPALVLTPPIKGTETDEGHLTASEVAQLKLDADWLILSACNTNAADVTPGRSVRTGKGVIWRGRPHPAGLALAGGLRCHRYSHHLLALVSEDPTHAKAHRQAILTKIDKGPARNVHPALWAHFVVVSEGGVLIQSQ